MKKLLLMLLVLSLSLMSLVGCSQAPSPTPETSTGSFVLNEGTTLQAIIDQINQDIGLQMPGPVDDQMLQDMFHINPADVESYYGVFGMTMTTADNAIAVKAVPGKIDTVVAALEQRKADVVSAFAQYLPDQYEKAEAGKVIQKGDYAFLLILGDYEKGYDNEMAKAEAIIDSYFAQ
ncbi:MAG: DUF4358 domain-containing protein [Cellulosilyticaceae bacterium]